MKIAILGTRGIPNSYGGFEQFAEYLSVGLVAKGHSVTVYNVHYHDYKDSQYKGVSIRKVYSPEKTIGAAANFIYDFLCLKDALRQGFDIIYELGYHSNAPSYYLLRKNSPIVITNMDGLEWKRSKWKRSTQVLIKRLEKLAVRKSDYLVSDSRAIAEYYKKQFGADSYFIPYGACVVENYDEKILSSYVLSSFGYYLLIARLEPENNIEMILDGFVLSQSNLPFLVIGNYKTKYGNYLQEKYKKENIRFVGSLYDKVILDSLRHFASIYFHGHSVGGTNPSLLEAMASGAYIASHDNAFNREVLQTNALYFDRKEKVREIICSDTNTKNDSRKIFIQNNADRINLFYSWDKIINDYEYLFQSLLKE